MAARSPVVVAAVRTPVGRLGGALAEVRPDDLAARAIQALVEKAPALDPGEIDDVYFGCANQAGEDNRNVARMALLLAGLPQSVPGATVNRLCASGLEAINCAARAIVSGEGSVFIAGGVESMSRAPWAFPKASAAFPRGNVTAWDTALGWRFPNPHLGNLFPLLSMGETAENVARKYGIGRRDQDEFALRSHSLAARAADEVFDSEIAAVDVPRRKGGPLRVLKDETIRRDSSLEKLAALPAAFREGGTVTAGNSSTLNDGSAALLLMEEGRARSLGLKPLARWRGSACAGVDPSYMGIGPVAAIGRLMARMGEDLKGVDLIEINEAFAAQALACARELDIDMDRLNVRGGAIALGHPLGSSGARISVTLIHEMARRGARRGISSLCVGVGQGLATLWEGA